MFVTAFVQVERLCVLLFLGLCSDKLLDDWIANRLRQAAHFRFYHRSCKCKAPAISSWHSWKTCFKMCIQCVAATLCMAVSSISHSYGQARYFTQSFC